MKKIIILFLSVIMILNLVIITKGNTVYAENPNIIWLEKEYDRVYGFKEGLAKVELKNKCGYIDKSGKEVVPIKYDST